MLGLLGAVAVLLAVVGEARATPTAAAANTVTFPDSTGENAAAPDIASIVVANDDKSNLSFTVSIPNRPTLTGDMLLFMPIDSDANAGSGSPDFGGADYIVELDGPLQGNASIGLFRWNGTDFVADGVQQTTLVFSYTNGAATVRINAAELGATRRFSFSVIAASGIVIGANNEPDFTNVQFDVAPQQGTFTYDVRLTPPALVVRSSGSRPLRPTAGKLYSPFVVVARNDGAALQGGTLTCRATVAGRALVPVSRSLIGNRATCTFRVPKTAKGKTIRVTITVRSGGLTATRTSSARIL